MTEQSAPPAFATVRPLSEREAGIATRRWQALAEAAEAYERARQAWGETIDLITGGDPDLGVDPRTMSVVRRTTQPEEE